MLAFKHKVQQSDGLTYKAKLFVSSIKNLKLQTAICSLVIEESSSGTDAHGFAWGVRFYDPLFQELRIRTTIFSFEHAAFGSTMREKKRNELFGSYGL
jgi:hypothetical protein